MGTRPGRHTTPLRDAANDEHAGYSPPPPLRLLPGVQPAKAQPKASGLWTTLALVFIGTGLMASETVIAAIAAFFGS